MHDEIHVSQMHPERDVSDMKGYMRDTCGIHAGYISRGLGECFDAIIIAKVTDTNVS